MFSVIISSNMILVMMLGFVVMTLFPSTLVYTAFLVSYVVMSVCFLVVYNLVPGLMALLIILVYVGAMMVMISYICAVSPNIKYYRSILHNFSLTVYFLVILFTLLGSMVTFSLFFEVSLSPSVLFSDIGVIFLCLVCLFMVLILMYSTYINPIASSFRSSSVKN